MPLPLTELFPDEDFRFHLTLRRGDLGGFFSAPDAAVLTERRQWLDSTLPRYAAVGEGAELMLAEFEALAAGWVPALADKIPAASDSPLSRLRTFGGELEPDFMLLARDDAGVFRLRAGVVCFPSAWSLPEKMGLTLDEIHGVVPGLNPALGATIGQFLNRLKPGTPYERANWGLAATPELNLHPDLSRPRLTTPVDPGKVWVRIEDQILAALPVSGGILFGIRLRLVPLAQILAEPSLKKGFAQALVTMPEPLAAYKGMAAIRGELLAAMAGG
jgi:hypothetical protein